MVEARPGSVAWPAGATASEADPVYLREHPQRRGITSARAAALLLPLAGVLALALAKGVLASATLWSLAGIALIAITVVPGGALDVAQAALRRVSVGSGWGAPWNREHTWCQTGATRSRWTRAARLCLGVPMVVLILAGNRIDPLLLFVTGLVLSLVAWRVFRVEGLGDTHLSFVRFPYFPGERAVFTFGASRGGARFLTAGFALHQLVEVPVWWFPWYHRVYLTRSVPIAPARDRQLPGADEYVEIAFDVPADARGTALSERCPVYWELDVSGQTTAGRYSEQFLVPIYDRPAEAVEEA